MDKQIVVYNRIVFSYKRNEIMISASLWLDLKTTMPSECNQTRIGHISYNPICMKYLDYVNPQRQKSDCWLPGDKIGIHGK